MIEARGGRAVGSMLHGFEGSDYSGGLAAGQGMIETAPYYWDQNAAARAFGERFRTRTGRMPNMAQAGAYGAVIHNLNAARDTGVDAAQTVLAKMRATPVNDFMTKDGQIRDDGRVVRDMVILEVKSAAESRGEWDLEKVIGTIPGSNSKSRADKSPTCFANLDCDRSRGANS